MSRTGDTARHPARARGSRRPAGCPARAWWLLAATAAAGCSAEAGAPGGRGAVGRLVATEGELTRRVLLGGELDAVSALALTTPDSEVWPMTIQWMVDDGARVTAGQKVVEFDNGPLASQLEERRLAVLGARSALAQTEAESRVAIADKEFAVVRHEVAVKRAEIQAAVGEDVYPRRVYQQNQLALEQARSALAQARDELAAQRKSDALQIQVKRLELQTAVRAAERVESQLAALVLRAPDDGIFVVDDHPWQGRKLQVGDPMFPGFPVAKLPDLSAMQVEALLSDVDDGRIAVGMRAECVLDAYPELTFHGEVASVSPVAHDPEQGSLRRMFDVVIALDVTDPERMRPGMSVKAVVVAQQPERGVIAPRAGLDLTGERPRARVAGGAVDVDVAFCTPQACLIRSGLEPGDELRPAGGGA